MTDFKKIGLILAILALPIWSYSSSNTLWAENPFDLKNEIETREPQQETMTLTITINSIYVVYMKDVPVKGYLEVYGILGKREKRIELANCDGQISIDLTKGLYILKAEKITNKIRIQ